ncbi:MAG: HAD-IA family hydrolase [Desulfovibrionaceae bacterium]
MRLKALIWDVDGTMVDNEELHRAAFNQAFEDFGLGWCWGRAVYADLLRVTGGRERILHFMERAACVPPNGPSPHALAAVLHVRKTVIYNRLLGGGAVALRPGVRRLLRQARDRGVLLAIATTTSRINVHTLLGKTLASEGIAWAAMTTGEDVARKKPAPEVYAVTLARLGLAPGQCLALEDSAHGVAAACDAGIRTIAVVNGYTENQDMGRAFAAYSHFGEPDSPCAVRHGPAVASGCVDLDHLAAWL